MKFCRVLTKFNLLMYDSLLSSSSNTAATNNNSAAEAAYNKQESRKAAIISPRVVTNNNSAAQNNSYMQSNATPSAVLMSQPLQARSSNSGTSVKRSDNISQSSYPAGDISQSDIKACQSMAKGPSISSSSNGGGISSQMMVHGVLTNCFAQAAGNNTQTSSSSAQNRDSVGATGFGGASTTATLSSGNNTGSGKEQPIGNFTSVGSQRRQAGLVYSQRRSGVSGLPEQPRTPSGPAPSFSGQGLGGTLTRGGAGRVTRGSEQRAVKDSSCSTPVGQPSVDFKAQSLRNGSSDRAESVLKPVKQSNSETGTMRTTRSKAKAQQSDKIMSERPPVAEESCATSIISNGQSQKQQKVSSKNPQCTVRLASRNLEKTNIDYLTVSKNDRNHAKAQLNKSWTGEESKQQSPRSLNNSTLVVPNVEKGPNQSFQINDSTDSLLENPLSSVIKQFQNMRTSAQLTGGNKPTIQQFLEKFEEQMHYLEDQYQAQQAAREEQMRLFELHYGGKAQPDAFKPRQLGGAGLPYGSQNQQPNDQLFGNGQSGQLPTNTASSNFNDTLMVQDTSTLGPMPHDNSNNNSFVSALHGPNHATGSVFGASSELTSSEVYESFQFTPNALMSFYPRQVRKILSRRKTHNSANATQAEIRDLKQPKHRAKIAKTMSKMQGLAVCQMNMMQIMLQKISRRSKVIRKQEKVVNDNLKRKRIYLEKEKFDLMSVLRKSLEASESGLAGTSASGQPSISASSNAQLAQKSKTRATNSDLNSRCPSTVGTKSGVDQVNTQSIKGSIQAQPYGEEIISTDGCHSRKQTRILSGAENCLLSMPEDLPKGASYSQNQVLAQGKVAQTPELSACKTGVNNRDVDDKLQRAEEKVKQAVNLSEIDDTFLNISDKSQHASSVRKGKTSASGQIMLPTDRPGAQSAQLPRMSEQTFREGSAAFINQVQTYESQNQTPKKALAKAGQSKRNMDVQTPVFEHDQYRHGALIESQTPDCTRNDEPAGAELPRKMQSTANRRGKKRGTMGSLERDGLQSQMVPINLESKLDKVADSFTLVDGREADEVSIIGAGANSSLVQTQHNADGKIMMTIKKQDSKMSQERGNVPSTAQLQVNGQKQSASKSKKRKIAKAGSASCVGGVSLGQKAVKVVQTQSKQKLDHEVQNQSQSQVNQLQKPSELTNAQFKSQEQKIEDQAILSPYKQELQHAQNQSQNTGAQQLMGQPHFFHSQSLPLHFEMLGGPQHLPQMPHQYYDDEMINDAQIMNHEHYMRQEEAHRQGIFYEQLKNMTSTADVAAVGGGHNQHIDNQKISMHTQHQHHHQINRSQSVMLPHHAYNYSMGENPQHHHHMDSLAVPSSLAGGPVAGYEQFGADPSAAQGVQAPHHDMGAAHDVRTQEGQVVGGIPGQNPSKPRAATNLPMDPLFDESAQELSSIEHTANAGGVADSYVGFNPYEQAKRTELKRQNQAAASQSQANGEQHQLKVVEQSSHMQHLHTHFMASPMGADAPVLSSAQVTPQPKQLAQDGGAACQQPIASLVGVVDGAAGQTTPSNFMSGVEIAGATVAGDLGRGSAVDVIVGGTAAENQHQLSVSRLCGNGAADPFNMVIEHNMDASGQGPSVAGGNHHHHELSNMRRQNHPFMNTPAGLLSHGQVYHQHPTDAHRQHLSVSGWNLDDPVSSVHHHLGANQPTVQCVDDAADMVGVSGTGNVDDPNCNQIYEGLPGHYM